MKYSNLEIFVFVITAILAIMCVLLAINTFKNYYRSHKDSDGHLNDLEEELNRLKAEAKLLEEELNK